MKRGTIIVISGPSGGGKTTISDYVLNKYKDIQRLVTHTTRPRRNNEVNGQDYHFIERDFFESLIEQNAFFEHAENYGNLYGSLRKDVQNLRYSGKHVLFTIDVKGFLELKRREEILGIFVSTGSYEALESRMRNRGDSEEDIAKRMVICKGFEVPALTKFDYFVNNDFLSNARLKIDEILAENGLA